MVPDALIMLTRRAGYLLTTTQSGLWQLRNVMLHSFGLLAKVSDPKQPADLVRFMLVDEGMDVIVNESLPKNECLRWERMRKETSRS